MAAGEPFLGSVNLVGFNFAPYGWAFCNGQLLQIAQNSALFSLLGTYYGGNGTTNFNLPDMRGRVPIGAGLGPNLPNYGIGQAGGEATHTLTINELPLHNHTIDCNDTASGRDLLESPTGNIPAKSSTSSKNYAASSAQNKAMSPTALCFTGGNAPHNNMQPYVALNYIIALMGVYPSRQ